MVNAAKSREAIFDAYTRSGAVLRPRSSSWFLSWLDLFVPSMGGFWITFRAPFRQCVIYHPDEAAPEEAHDTIWHELDHVALWQRWYGPFIVPALYLALPCPVFLAWGRWYVERSAYLRTIEQGRFTVDAAVQWLWHSCMWPWPRFLMRRWFEKKMAANGV